MKFEIEVVAIRQDNSGSYRDEFFVDDETGKNHRVFGTRKEAVAWIAAQRS